MDFDLLQRIFCAPLFFAHLYHVNVYVLLPLIFAQVPGIKISYSGMKSNYGGAFLAMLS